MRATDLSDFKTPPFLISSLCLLSGPLEVCCLGLILPVHHTVKRLPPLARMTKAELLLLVLLSAELGLRSQARLFLMPFLLYTAVLYPLTLIYTFLFFHLLTALCYFSLTEQSGILEILGSRFSFLRSLWAPWSKVCNECISDLQKECGSENRMNAGLQHN